MNDSQENEGLEDSKSKNQESLEVKRQVEIQQIYLGPLPKPEDLEKYNNIVPGSAERILSMAERQAMHRQELEKKVVFSDSRDSFWARIFGTIISLSAIAFSFYAVSKGYSLVGVAIVFWIITALSSVFIYGSRQQRLEREAKHN